MKIHEVFKEKKPLFSYEIFPPKRDGDLGAMLKTIEALAKQKPDFISVTYGAAGSERNDNTLNMAKDIQRTYGLSALAHLTCAGATQSEMDVILNRMKNEGLENLLLLRGDLPDGYDAEASGFRYASDLIRHVKAKYDFSIGAACYPEGHIESKSRTVDLIHLRDKVQAGADFLITQLFFDNERFFDFTNEARCLDIKVPIFAGVMPVLSRVQIERMVALSGAYLPSKFKRVLSRYEHNPEALADAGIAYALEQIVDLLSSGVDGIHLYVMNKPEISERLIRSVSALLEDLKHDRSSSPL